MIMIIAIMYNSLAPIFIFSKFLYDLPKLPQACNFIKKETLAQVFSCEFFEISKNTFFYRTPPVTAFDTYKSKR